MSTISVVETRGDEDSRISCPRSPKTAGQKVGYPSRNTNVESVLYDSPTTFVGAIRRMRMTRETLFQAS
jgi:hypothetical protein